MNLFEKIFNYQIISRLEDSGTFMATSHERSWLKSMLLHPSARDAFREETFTKLQAILEPDEAMDLQEHFLEKAQSLQRQVIHPLLRPLRRYILQKKGIRIVYSLKGGRVCPEQTGFPYKLEYSMVKREWYLLWYHFRHRTFMSTRLEKITAATGYELMPGHKEHALKQVDRMLALPKETAVVEVVPTYNRELSRILYAFSCFEKDVTYDADNQLYRICLSFAQDEREYMLSKLRFLGKRVRIVEGEHMKRRMLETSRKALERYGAMSENDAR
ncbi:WYL domain-containing protein [Paenibacillus sepulcri]|uniref:WYL domain-containing protein n=1 Tax=Paenibacillus sepulcri TaxID=359917 RepID=A0ABS7C0E2_9BACL|nr:WYL domain-containing protein [Paenibacillus sepulcri]